MVDMLVGSLVDSLVSTAVEGLKRIAQDEATLLLGVPDEIRRLSITFASIQAVLEDAEAKRVKDKAVMIWLEKVKEIAYDVDDILDDWRTEALKSQAHRDEGSSLGKSKVRICSPLSTCFSHVGFRHKIGKRIKKASERLSDIAEEIRQLALIGLGHGKVKKTESELRQEMIKWRETGSHVDNLQSIVGRERDKDAILELLLKESGGEVNEEPIVSAIVGMGGLGKTTVAQLAYNDQTIEAHFHLRMWVCVSENFDVQRITKSIIESATGCSCEPLDLDPLQNRLRNMLNAKRFLLVLDDVWSEDSESWDKLHSPLQAGAIGSRILITTRNEKVALAMGSTHVHKLRVLSGDECWLLFSRKAFWRRTENERSDLEVVGRQIVDRCGGLPLAAKTIGSAMRSRTTRREWELVLESEIWTSQEILGGILPALLLSYYDLPPALKRCFAYCSVFPKDWRIQKDELVRLWMAQGFIQSEEGGDMEGIGELYFDDLLRRSLFQDEDRECEGTVLRCKMHDLVHDLAQAVACSECSSVYIEKQSSLNPRKLRHVLLYGRIFDPGGLRRVTLPVNRVRALFGLCCLCGVFPLCCCPPLLGYIFTNIFPIPYFLTNLWKAHELRTVLITENEIRGYRLKLFNQWRCPRALALHVSPYGRLPRGIGQLKHLRYLSVTGIRELPEEVSNCVNLQTLILRRCHTLNKLPKGIEKLIRLRHLDLEYTGIVQLNAFPSLLELKISDCPKLKAVRFELLPILRKLTLEGDNDGLFSAGPLPGHPKLQHLELSAIRELPDGWLGQLKALQTLVISKCPALLYLPDELRCLTGLQELVINSCSLLRERCKEGQEEWGKISHIPRVRIH